LFRFEEPVRTLIHELKFGDRYSCSRLFAALLADAIGKLEHHPEVLIPVPLHWRRYQQREFNQSLEIARQLHEHLAIPLSTDHCRRIRHTTPQSDLSSAERRKNLKNAFHIVNPIPYSHAAIVDDVVTTATTVNEIAKTLKKSGVIRVDVFAVARA
jgi:ComF family protein